MSLEKSNYPWSTKQITSMIKGGTINFDHVVQRSYVWEKARKSLLIDSIISGYPINKIYAKRDTTATGVNEQGVPLNKIHYILDGKQRLSTVKEYLNDEFALTELKPTTYTDLDTNEEITVDISGLKFSELPEQVKHQLETRHITIECYDNLTEEQERELFKRLNAGKPLTAKSKLLASCKNITELIAMGEHVLFGEMLSDKAKSNKDHVTVIMKTWCMLNKKINDISFQFKVFKPIVESVELKDEDKAEIIAVYDYIYKMYEWLSESSDVSVQENKIAKKIITETHLISLVPYVKQAIENDYKVEDMVAWVSEFYGVQGATSVSDAYNMASLSGVVKPSNIASRDRALKKSFKKHFSL